VICGCLCAGEQGLSAEHLRESEHGRERPCNLGASTRTLDCACIAWCSSLHATCCRCCQIDGSMIHGTSRPSKTFNSPQLSVVPEYEIVDLEVKKARQRGRERQRQRHSHRACCRIHVGTILDVSADRCECLQVWGIGYKTLKPPDQSLLEAWLEEERGEREACPSRHPSMHPAHTIAAYDALHTCGLRALYITERIRGAE